jgi:RNA binding exosome subunit
VRKPDPFTGNPRDWETFKCLLRLYVRNRTTDADKIWDSLALFTQGSADQWAKNYTDINQTAIDGGNKTWDQFIADADAYWQDPLVKSKAKAELKDMKMHPDETVQAFYVRFDKMRRLAKREDSHHDDDLIEMLRGMLPKKVVELVDMAWTSSQMA